VAQAPAAEGRARVKWLLRFLLWATLFSIPCAFVSHAYQRGLARVAMVVLAAVGQGVEIDEVQVMAPFDLAILAAMCLASLGAPWAARRRALLIGLAHELQHHDGLHHEHWDVPLDAVITERAARGFTIRGRRFMSEGSL